MQPRADARREAELRAFHGALSEVSVPEPGASSHSPSNLFFFVEKKELKRGAFLSSLSPLPLPPPLSSYQERRDVLMRQPGAAQDRARGAPVSVMQPVSFDLTGQPALRGSTSGPSSWNNNTVGSDGNAAAPSTTSTTITRTGMISFADRCSKEEAGNILSAIITFIVGNALPFTVVDNKYFKDLLHTLRPAFDPHMRGRTYFSTTALDNLTATVRAKVERSIEESDRLITLGFDGWKNVTGAKVLNVTEQCGTSVFFKNSVPFGENSANEKTHVDLITTELRTRPMDKFVALVCDNAAYMLSTLRTVEEKFPKLLVYGCVAHLLDLLAEDMATQLQGTVNDVKFLITFILSHDKVREQYRRVKKSMAGMGLRTYPETRFGYVHIMIRSVMENKETMRRMLSEPEKAAWSSATSSARETAAKFRVLVDNSEFWDRADSAAALLAPVSKAIAHIEGDKTKLAYVYVLYQSLLEDLSMWDSTAIDPALKATVVAQVKRRWEGEGRLVGLQSWVYLAALMLNPYTTPPPSCAPPGHVEAVTMLFKKFTATEDEVDKCIASYQEFLAGDGVFGKMKLDMQAEVERKFVREKAAWVQEHPGKTMSCTEQAIMRLNLMRDPVAQLKLVQHHHPAFVAIQIRIAQPAPTAAGTERVNSMNKIVHTARRASLLHPRVKKLMYNYVNMRIVNKMDDELTTMFESVMDDTLEDVAAEEAAAAEVDGPNTTATQQDEVAEGDEPQRKQRKRTRLFSLF